MEGWGQAPPLRPKKQGVQARFQYAGSKPVSNGRPVLAGTTTIGTQAAVEYVCRAKSIDELLRRLNRPAISDVGPFEAGLRVKVSRGVPVGAAGVA